MGFNRSIIMSKENELRDGKHLYLYIFHQQYYNIIPALSGKATSTSFTKSISYLILFCLAAVKETLRRDGFLNKLQAEMRVRVMGLLGEGLQGDPGIPEKPRLPQEILFLNELIREYLEWMAYTYSNSVFISGKTSVRINSHRWVER